MVKFSFSTKLEVLSFRRILLGISSVGSYLPKHLLVAATNSCKIYKIFIYKKVWVYVQGSRLQFDKKPRFLACGMGI